MPDGCSRSCHELMVLLLARDAGGGGALVLALQDGAAAPGLAGGAAALARVRARVRQATGALLWRGLRVRMGMAFGRAEHRKPLNTGAAPAIMCCSSAACLIL